VVVRSCRERAAIPFSWAPPIRSGAPQPGAAGVFAELICSCWPTPPPKHGALGPRSHGLWPAGDHTPQCGLRVSATAIERLSRAHPRTPKALADRIEQLLRGPGPYRHSMARRLASGPRSTLGPLWRAARRCWGRSAHEGPSGFATASARITMPASRPPLGISIWRCSKEPGPHSQEYPWSFEPAGTYRPPCASGCRRPRAGSSCTFCLSGNSRALCSMALPPMFGAHVGLGRSGLTDSWLLAGAAPPHSLRFDCRTGALRDERRGSISGSGAAPACLPPLQRRARGRQESRAYLIELGFPQQAHCFKRGNVVDNAFFSAAEPAPAAKAVSADQACPTFSG